MSRLFLLSLAVLLLFVLVVVVEAFPSARWLHVDRADPTDSLQFTIGLKQRNARRIEEYLEEISDPLSPIYGKYLNHRQVVELTAPAKATVEGVINWLISNGIDRSQIHHQRRSDWMSVTMSVEAAEKLLSTEYHRYQHKESGSLVTRCDSYSLPSEVDALIDVIGPTNRFPSLHVPIHESLPSLSSGVRSPSALCSETDPDCLRSLYQIGTTAASNSNTSICVTGYLEQYISLTDLTTFRNQFDKGNTDTPKIIGPNQASNPGIEASLDIQYISALTHNAQLSFWYTAGRQPGNPENEPFLVWLMDLANTTNPPLVVSTSYGDDEPGVVPDYAQRVNNEFAKAGVRGTSIIFASGDGGVSGGQSQQCTTFIPTFPAGCPYVTAVGGTRITSTSPLNESAVSFSSGGFSNYFDRPSWQTTAVSNYFNMYGKNFPNNKLYNQTGRGIPDVAAAGTNFPIVVGGFTYGVAGTSCSSPTFASVIALLNDVRLNAGKPPLGFLNPLIYQNGQVFNDITTGNNPGCGTNGFYAAEAWDPVTGWGTPNYPNMVKLIQSLP